MDANFSLFNIGVPDYLILRARKTTNPTAEAGTRAVLGPAPTGNLNFLITGLDAANYYFDLYESVDGVTLSELLGTFTYDVQNTLVVEELWYYVVGSNTGNSPADQATVLNDPNLVGKTITAFEKRSIGSLIPDNLGYTTEWKADGSNVITLQDGLIFTYGETYIVHASHATQAPTTDNASFFKGIKTITASLTMDATYRNCRIKLVGTATQLVVTFEDDTTIPNGTMFYFTDQDGGKQYQTKLLLQNGNFLYNGTNYSEFWVGKAEKLWIEFNDGVFEIIDPPQGAALVGSRSAEMLTYIPANGAQPFIGFPNKYLEDNSLWNADDLPRLWYWITHAFPNSNWFIVDDNLDAVGYGRPTSGGYSWKAGMFIISLTKRKFRMPDTQGFAERGSKSFNFFGTDTTRLFDYPGGFQVQMGLDHQHDTLVGNIVGNPNGTGPSKSGGKYGDPRTGITDLTSHPTNNAGVVLTTFGSENRVNNFSVVYMRYA